MNPVEPQRPDLARELITRATQAADRRIKRIRNQLDAVQLGQDRRADHADTKVLRRILAEFDWPTRSLVGVEASQAAWSLALHADNDPELQRAATTLLKRAVHDGNAPIKLWAHLHDRTLVNSGLQQEYGTQHLLNATGLELYPVCAPKSLDLRRIAVGLPPIATGRERVRSRLATDFTVGPLETVALMDVA